MPGSALRLGASNTQAAGDRRAHRFQVQLLPFNGGRSNRFLHPGLGRERQALFKTDGGQGAIDNALCAACQGNGAANLRGVVVQGRPAGLLP